MIQLDETFLAQAGLSQLTEAENVRILGYVAKTLETRVGIRFAKAATPEQLAEFTKITDEDTNDVMAWLEQSFPDYEVIVREELQRLSNDLKEMVAGEQSDIA